MKVAILFFVFLSLAGCATTSGVAFHNAGKPWSYSNKQGVHRFEVRPGDCWRIANGSCSARSELQFAKTSKNIDYWYAWDQKVHSQDTDIFNRPWMGQFFPSDGCDIGSPNLKQNFEGSQLVITLLASSDLMERCPRRGSGTREDFFAEDAFKFDEWNNIIYQVKWTPRDNGYLNIWINGVQVAKYTGPTMYNNQKGPHFKMGVYRGWYTPGTNIAEYKNFRYGSKSSVFP